MGITLTDSQFCIIVVILSFGLWRVSKNEKALAAENVALTLMNGQLQTQINLMQQQLQLIPGMQQQLQLIPGLQAEVQRLEAEVQRIPQLELNITNLVAKSQFSDSKRNRAVSVW
ncbi:hypothetical protein C8J56DRAFT_1056543 [Mycena floridula]|nr:hypothetical protein C8J56DRAFT_1056543 [Mycena floridula]